jgi:hypothetical protein
MDVNLFFNFNRNLGTTPLDSVLEKIKDGAYADSIQPLRDALSRGETDWAAKLKKALPAFTCSALYEGKRLTPNIVHYNGIVILDIDKLEPDVLERAEAKARELPYTLFCFRSPSGNGLKIGVWPSVSHPLTADMHKQTFKIVASWYERELGVVIDASGKDPGRLCFVSHDPAAYIDLGKLQADLPLMEEEKTEADEVLRINMKKFSEARRMTTLKMKYAEGNRNNYIFLFALNCAYKGLGFDEISLYCLKNFPDLSMEEAHPTILSACKSAQENQHNKKECKEYEHLICPKFAPKYTVKSPIQQTKNKYFFLSFSSGFITFSTGGR